LANEPLGGALKRTTDILFSVAALIVLALPLCLVALCIRLDSPGPVFFRQPRTGFRGRAFTILKFRTMRGNGEDATVQARPGDGRVTRLGRLLRATSVDELPQLLNVLRGEMSLVGPRPHALPHDRVFYGVNAEYPRRFMARPGITGLAQVAGARGRTATSADVETRLRYDLEYIDTWTIWSDLSIIVRTIGIVLSRRNAI
jgi:lipopolysaccharide/colanic/teichoic acid biosynthesis glycosyltransferase